jgi:hypothetical protein
MVPERLPELVSWAALDHAKYRSGAMQPELVASTPEELRAYLEPRVGNFPVELPDLQGWMIRGPRLCHFKNVPVGLVMLERGGQPVSLFLLSETDAESFGPGWISPEPTSFTLAPGYAVLAANGGTVRCAVGDIPLDQLTRLVDPSHQ